MYSHLLSLQAKMSAELVADMAPARLSLARDVDYTKAIRDELNLYGARIGYDSSPVFFAAALIVAPDKLVALPRAMKASNGRMPTHHEAVARIEQLHALRAVGYYSVVGWSLEPNHADGKPTYIANTQLNFYSKLNERSSDLREKAASALVQLSVNLPSIEFYRLQECGEMQRILAGTVDQTYN